MFREGMVDRITLRSHARKRLELELELRVDTDFRPMLEVRGLISPATRTVRREAAGERLRLSAVGLDDRERSTTVVCPGAAAEDDGRFRVPVKLDPGDAHVLETRFELAQQNGDSGSGPNRAARLGARRSTSTAGAEADAWLANRACVEVDDDLFDRIFSRSLLDLRLLASSLDDQRYFAAGLPWYATLFGRDSIITALQMLAFDPTMAEETLRLLARRLGTRIDDEHDEEPGKVLHELRGGELAATNLTPLVRYYGTVDATPLFLCLLCEHADWTGSLDLFRELRPQVEQALRWIDDFGDLDGDGLLEYRCRSSAGLCQPGLEGLVGRHRRRARSAAASTDRSSRGAGLRAQGQAVLGPAVRA
jgi:glycogen debranching enzyme